MKRLLGILIFISGIIGVVIALGGFLFLPRLIDRAVATLDQTLLATNNSLNTVSDTLLLAKQSVGDVSQTLVTVQTNMDQLGQAVNETTPLLNQLSAVATDEVPQSIEAVQTAIPDMAQVAAIIDDTLTTLNNFRIDESFFGIDLNYSLGVDYEPTEPFDETVLNLGEGLEGLPDSLRTLKVYLGVTQENLEDIRDGLFAMADDLETLNGRLDELDPLLNDYLQIITDTNDQTRLLRTQMNKQLSTLKLVVRLGMIWLVLAQLAPLYLGWELFTGQRNTTHR